MRIYGGHDYYDSALSLGIDSTITLIRGKSKTVPVKTMCDSLLGFEMRLLPEQTMIERVSVVFCGKLYRGAMASRNSITHYFWSAIKLREFANEIKKGGVGIYQPWYSRKREKKPTLQDYFSPVEAPIAVRRYMIDHKISILVQHERHRMDEEYFEVNPFGLKKLGFAKALDPYTAFQELSMWIGGILGGTSPEIVSITDDKVLIENHGYDKHSFRSSSRVA